MYLTQLRDQQSETKYSNVPKACTAFLQFKYQIVRSIQVKTIAI